MAATDSITLIRITKHTHSGKLRAQRVYLGTQADGIKEAAAAIREDKGVDACNPH